MAFHPSKVGHSLAPKAFGVGCLRFESGAPAIAGAHSKGTAISKTSVFAFEGRVLLLLGAELDAKHIPNAGVGNP